MAMAGEPSRIARAMTWTAWCLAGVVLAVVAWLVIVPWDLSTVDAAGNQIPGGGDRESGPRIALALAVILITALAVDRFRARANPVALAAAGSATWALLFAWRAAVSRVGGANMWPLAYVTVVAPAAVLGSFMVAGITHWRATRRPSR